MTAVLPRPQAQPRRPAGDGKGRGGQFAPKFATPACPSVYALLDGLADAAPDPQPTAANPTVERPGGGWAVYAPTCPHGSFLRYAQRNCCRPAGAPTPTASTGDAAAQCTGTTTSGDRCTRTTTRTFHGRPACHDHGGTQ